MLTNLTLSLSRLYFLSCFCATCNTIAQQAKMGFVWIGFSLFLSLMTIGHLWKPIHHIIKSVCVQICEGDTHTHKIYAEIFRTHFISSYKIGWLNQNHTYSYRIWIVLRYIDGPDEVDLHVFYRLVTSNLVYHIVEANQCAWSNIDIFFWHVISVINTSIFYVFFSSHLLHWLLYNNGKGQKWLHNTHLNIIP